MPEKPKERQKVSMPHIELIIYYSAIMMLEQSTPFILLVLFLFRMQGNKVCIIWAAALSTWSLFPKKWWNAPQEQVSLICRFR